MEKIPRAVPTLTYGSKAWTTTKKREKAEYARKRCGISEGNGRLNVNPKHMSDFSASIVALHRMVIAIFVNFFLIFFLPYLPAGTYTSFIFVILLRTLITSWRLFLFQRMVGYVQVRSWCSLYITVLLVPVVESHLPTLLDSICSLCEYDIIMSQWVGKMCT